MGPKRSNKRPEVTRKTTEVQLPNPEFNPDAESPSKVKRRREEEKQESDPEPDEPKGLLSDIEDEFDDIISGTYPVNTTILDGHSDSRFTSTESVSVLNSSLSSMTNPITPTFKSTRRRPVDNIFNLVNSVEYKDLNTGQNYILELHMK
jgi:hypothetical protein